ncbi:MAG: hypothetical protein EBU46_06065 [Nitrosomonadaceae bacterium]|nr:hypothetical protein [Nitrosomonadaceae bacterium]
MAKKKKTVAEETPAELLVQVNTQLAVLDQVKNDLPLANVQEARKKLAALQDQFAVIEKQLEADENAKWLQPFLDQYEDKYWLYEYTHQDFTSRSIQYTRGFKLDFDHNKQRMVRYARFSVSCGLQHPAGTPKRRRALRYGEQFGFYQHVDMYATCDNIWDMTRNRTLPTTKQVYDYFCELATDDAERYYAAIEKAVVEGIDPTIVTTPNDQRKLVLT